MADGFDVRSLGRDDLARVAEIDRTEHIEVLYVQHGTLLVERRGDWDSPPWERDGHGEHSVAAKLRELHGYVDRGGVALGALRGGGLVGIGVVVPHLRPGIAQLAFLHVSAPFRGHGIGARLTERMDDIAANAGSTEMVVSATPSKHTVDFYLGRGFSPTAHPLQELVELEPDDVHLCKAVPAAHPAASPTS